MGRRACALTYAAVGTAKLAAVKAGRFLIWWGRSKSTSRNARASERPRRKGTSQHIGPSTVL